MNLFENFYIEIKGVFLNGVFGISLNDIAIIVTSIIVALLIRGIFARILVFKVKKL